MCLRLFPFNSNRSEVCTNRSSMASAAVLLPLSTSYLVEPGEDLVEAMVANHADALVVPLKAYPDFFVERKELVQQLTERGMAVVVR